MLYLLAFTTPEFAMKVACVLSKVEGDKNEITHWLRTFVGAVEYKLETGSAEEDILTVDERISLDANFKVNIQESQEYRTESGPSLSEMTVVQLPSCSEDDRVQDLDEGYTVTAKVMRGDDISDEEDFWE